MDQNFGFSADQAAAFQKMWTDSAAKILEATLTTSPNSPPPEVLRQIRSGIFAALAQSWDEFMRSPQFLGAMKEWMENAISFRKMSNDFLARIRNEMQAPSSNDTDTVMLNVRHMEKRLLDRIEELSGELKTLKNGLRSAPGSKAAARKPNRTRRKQPA